MIKDSKHFADMFEKANRSSLSPVRPQVDNLTLVAKLGFLNVLNNVPGNKVLSTHEKVSNEQI